VGIRSLQRGYIAYMIFIYLIVQQNLLLAFDTLYLYTEADLGIFKTNGLI